MVRTKWTPSSKSPSVGAATSNEWLVVVIVDTVGEFTIGLGVQVEETSVLLNPLLY